MFNGIGSKEHLKMSLPPRRISVVNRWCASVSSPSEISAKLKSLGAKEENTPKRNRLQDCHVSVLSDRAVGSCQVLFCHIDDGVASERLHSLTAAAAALGVHQSAEVCTGRPNSVQVILYR